MYVAHRCRWTVAALLAFAMPLARQGLADAPEEPIRLAVSAPDGCLDSENFLAEIRARTTRARLATEREKARLFSAFLTLEAPGSRGVLVITGTDGQSLVRDVPGASCTEVASALALIAALAIDPNARVTPVAALPAPSPGPAAPPVPASVSPTQACVQCPAPVVPPPRYESPPAAPSLGVGLWGGAEALSGVAPSVVAAASVGWELFRERRWRLARIGLVRTAASSHAQADGSVKFTLTAARMEVCPVGFEAGQRVSVRGCGRAEAGLLNADAVDPRGAHVSGRGWMTAGGLGAVRWEPARGLVFEGHFGVAMPLVRDRFTWHDGTTVHHVPALQVLGGIGMGVHFL